MYLAQCSLNIVGGQEVGNGYVELRDGQVYRIRLRNDRDVRCDAYVEVNGDFIGAFRVNAHRSVVLERPQNDDGQFTFASVNSWQAQAGGVGDINPNNYGLVSAQFRFEYDYSGYRASVLEGAKELAMPVAAAATPDTYRSVSRRKAGITVLTGHSGQRFHAVQDLEYDPRADVTITLRLTLKQESTGGVRPVTPVSNTPPPPVW